MVEKYDLEIYLGDMECPECNWKGMKENGDGRYICPMCLHEGSIYEEEYDVEEHFKGRHCPMCGELARFELLEDSTDAYVCLECGYEGSIRNDIQNDIDEREFFWNDALHGYSEEGKGEVFDNMLQ